MAVNNYRVVQKNVNGAIVIISEQRVAEFVQARQQRSFRKKYCPKLLLLDNI